MSGGVFDVLDNLDMDESNFIGLLTKLIGVSKQLQNNPAQGLIPREDAASDHVLEALAPYSKANGGVLDIERVSFVEGRGNVIIKYPGTTSQVCSFVGSHLDVVPANPQNWDRDPFTLVREGDLLYGRGTTDCLGHIAMLVDFIIALAKVKPALKTTLVFVFIANEENSSFKGIGIDQLAKEGYMDQLKAGPLFWIDSADSQPCVGTAGMVQWKVKAVGKLFHSGLPHKGINAIEMAMDSVNYIQQRFYKDFPKHEMEDKYNFATQSTLKPTQITCTPGSLNQLPPECTVQGDVRLAPFYDVADVRRALQSYVDEISANPSIIESPQFHGPHSKYSLPEEGRLGKLELSWVSEGENGIACKLDSPGYKAILEATRHIMGSVKPFSIGGSLPLIRELQEHGFDVQIAGYGFSSRYHADNENVSLDNMKKALRIMAKIVSLLEQQ